MFVMYQGITTKTQVLMLSDQLITKFKKTKIKKKHLFAK